MKTKKKDRNGFNTLKFQKKQNFRSIAGCRIDSCYKGKNQILPRKLNMFKIILIYF